MKWVLADTDDSVTAALISDAGFHPLIAKLMVNRGITEVDAARSFYACNLMQLSQPDIFLGMEKAVNRIRTAIKNREIITLYGDYDVDGVTGVSLLYLVLKKLGAQVTCHIPDRMSEGYGLNQQALSCIKTNGSLLVISVDCGITARLEAAFARTLGIDLIITDHHEFCSNPESAFPLAEHTISTEHFESVLPDAYAILHPLLLHQDCSECTREQVRGLTGVGVAFKLAHALLNVSSTDEALVQYLDLVALGTLADIGKITGENRILVKHGLDILSSGDTRQRPGIAALMQVSGLQNRKISAGTVGFSLAPRINASGRLEKADAAFHLLTTDSREEANKLAATLDAVNRERQSIEEQIWQDAQNQCKEIDLSTAGAFVFASDVWHQGVIGIVASRIVEAFYRPAALIYLQNGVGKGSARSIPGFDLYQGLQACSDLLLGFGGHKYAAGFSIAIENVPAFRERLNSLVLERIGSEGFIRTLSIDCGVLCNDLSPDLVQEIEKLAPFGQGNPEPRLGARDLEVVSSRVVGNNHLKMRLRQNDMLLDAIAFNRGTSMGKQIRNGMRIAAVFTPRLNAWSGKETVELEIRDLRKKKTAFHPVSPEFRNTQFDRIQVCRLSV
ncbi:MAG: single-stranded-DNA-specific exonuclease RecJ [Nitrospirota bacterium]